MGTEDNPDVKIEYGSDTNVPPSSWTDLMADAVSFNIRDAGVLKVPVVTIELANKNGKYTSGTDALVYWRPIRIRADVRGVFDTIFYGRLYRTEGEIRGKKIPSLRLICRGLGRKLLEDTITKPYYDMYTSGEQTLTMKQVIEDFLEMPDSKVNTGILLETDTGVITTTYAQHNFRQTSLQDALRNIGEKLDYDGYVYVNTVDQIKLMFKKIGTVAASPAIILNHPYILAEPVLDIDEIKNHVFPWGDIDVGYPADMDVLTEKDILTNWIGATGVTVSEDTTRKVLGNKSVKIARNVSPTTVQATLTLPTTVDASTGAYTQLFGQFKVYAESILIPMHLRYFPDIILYDDAVPANKIRYSSWAALPTVSLQQESDWDRKLYPIYDVDIHPAEMTEYNDPRLTGYEGWYFVQGTSFSWKITKIEFIMKRDGSIINTLWVDSLFFVGTRKIDPVKYPSLQRVAATFPYGRRVYHHEDQEIKSFDQAQAIGNYILNVNKDIIKKFRVKVKGKSWAHINENVTFNLAEYGISSETWRTTEIEHEWKRPKYFRTSLTLVPQNQFVGSQAYLADTLEGMLKYR